jgi:hypothetical protein
MKWMLAGAAVAAFMTAFGSTASASVCSTDCDHSYGVCNGLNGGNAQQICMPKWMQCKKSCAAPAGRTPTKVSNITPKPKH